MCFSAQAWQDHRKFNRELGATLGIAEYVRLWINRVSCGINPIMPLPEPAMGCAAGV